MSKLENLSKYDHTDTTSWEQEFTPIYLFDFSVGDRGRRWQKSIKGSGYLNNDHETRNNIYSIKDKFRRVVGGGVGRWYILPKTKISKVNIMAICGWDWAFIANNEKQSAACNSFLSNTICMKLDCSFSLSFFSKHQRWIHAWRDPPSPLFLDQIS